MSHDLLNTYPVSLTPETWPMNDLYLEVIRRQIKRSDEMGYTWQFGLEVEFAPIPPKIFDNSFSGYDPIDISTEFPYLVPSMELRKKLKQEDHLNLFLNEEITSLVNYVTESTDLDDYLQEVDYSKEEIIEDLEEYREQLKDPNEVVAIHAHMNVYMAKLHLLPSALGGMRDIIIPRFGSYTYGCGWWDSPSTGEIRLPPTQDPFTFISAYHRLVDQLFSTCEDMNVVPMMHECVPQLHFSLWDREGNNITAMGNKEHADLGCSMMGGLFSLFSSAPYLINDFDPQNPKYSLNFSAGPEKEGPLIRQNGTSWELRRDYKSNYMHLARDIGLLMAGSLHGLTNPEEVDHKADFYDLYLCPYKHPIVKSTSSTNNNPIEHCLNESSIDEDEEEEKIVLLVPESAIRSRLDWLKSTIGDKFLTAHSVSNKTSDSIQHKLDTVAGWVDLLQNVSILENGELSAPHLHEEIQQHLTSLKVKGYRYVISCEAFQTSYGIDFLAESASIMADDDVCNAIFTPGEIESLSTFHVDQGSSRAQSLGEALVARQVNLLQTAYDEDYDHDPDSLKNCAIDPFRDSVIDGRIRESLLGRHISQRISSRVFHESQSADQEGREVDPEVMAMREAITSTRDVCFSKADFTRKSNAIKMVRPHFQAAATKRINELSGQPGSNYITTGLQAAAEYMDGNVININDADTVGSNEITHALTHSFVALMKSEKEAFREIADNMLVKNKWLARMKSCVNLMLEEPNVSNADIISTLKQARQQGREDTKEIIASLDEPERHMFIKDMLQNEVTKIAAEKDDYYKALMRYVVEIEHPKKAMLDSRSAPVI